MFTKKLSKGLLAVGLLSAISFTASATFVTTCSDPSHGHSFSLTHGSSGSEDFTYLGTPTAWDPGADTARVGANTFPAAGGATWSIIGAGAAYTDGALTTSMSALPGLSGLVSEADIATVMNNAIDVWANVSGFTNLGQVADSGADYGASDAAGGNVGDMRIGAAFIDGGVGNNTLATAFQPGTDEIFGTGGNIAGDIRFDDGNSWFISADAGLAGGQIGSGTIDLFTVAIHEVGHALGLGHTDVAGSIMEATYAGIRTSLSADDLAGIQSIYGTAVVPVPGALVLFLSGALGMIGWARRKQDV